jgi:hypothetical protein
MKTMNGKARSGGGITSNKNVRPAMRNPTQSKAVSPAGASQLGSAMGALEGHGNAAERLFQGHAPQSKFGNEVAKNVGAGGPGTGRTVHRAGGQGQHGAVAGTPARTGRDILSGFGPEIGGGVKR